MSEIEFKKCSKCNEVKPTTEYSKRSSQPDGLQVWCKSCMKDAANKSRGVKKPSRETKLKMEHESCMLVATESEVFFYVNGHEITEEELSILNGMLSYANKQLAS